MKVKFNKKQIGAVSQKILEKVLKIKSRGARILAFSGDLGSGKTTLTQEIAKRIGIKENIISPTYIIMKIYAINSDSVYYKYFKKLIHIDAYRLDSSEELLKIGWEEIQKDKDNLIILEWPQKVESCLNKHAFWIKLEHVDDETRSINF
jgi:tRNA threonylcarbamoyladenosine biosynthesis protein TsaE